MTITITATIILTTTITLFFYFNITLTSTIKNRPNFAEKLAWITWEMSRYGRRMAMDCKTRYRVKGLGFGGRFGSARVCRSMPHGNRHGAP